MGSLFRRLAQGHVAIPLGLGLTTLTAVVLVFQAMGYSVVQGDVFGYLNWSHHLEIHSCYPTHLPLFPALIGLMRFLTLQLASDVICARLVNVFVWLTGACVLDALLEDTAPRARRIGVALYALFPLVGIRSLLFPLADPSAHTALFATLLFMHRRDWGRASFALAAASLTHQAIFPSLALMGTGALLVGMPWWRLACAALPFSAYYAQVAARTGKLFWIWQHHRTVHLRSDQYRVSWLFDAVTTCFQAGTAPGILKGLFFLGVVAAALVLSVHFIRTRSWIWLGTFVPLALYVALLNQRGSHVILRFSPMMVPAFAAWLETRHKVHRLLQERIVYAALLSLCALSQLAMVAYSFSNVSAVLR